MRKPAALFVAAFATVAGGGLAVAVEGSPASHRDDAPSGPPFADMEWVGELPPGPPPHAAVQPEPEPEAVEVEVQVEQEAPAIVDAGPPADTHGATVSQAAHDCPHDDPERTHGECVSEVARGNGNGHGNGNEHGNAGGNGHGRGPAGG